MTFKQCSSSPVPNGQFSIKMAGLAKNDSKGCGTIWTLSCWDHTGHLHSVGMSPGIYIAMLIRLDTCIYLHIFVYNHQPPLFCHISLLICLQPLPDLIYNSCIHLSCLILTTIYILNCFVFTF